MITLRTIDDDLLVGKFDDIDEVLDYFRWSQLYDGNNTYID